MAVAHHVATLASLGLFVMALVGLILPSLVTSNIGNGGYQSCVSSTDATTTYGGGCFWYGVWYWYTRPLTSTSMTSMSYSGTTLSSIMPTIQGLYTAATVSVGLAWLVTLGASFTGNKMFSVVSAFLNVSSGALFLAAGAYMANQSQFSSLIDGTQSQPLDITGAQSQTYVGWSYGFIVTWILWCCCWITSGFSLWHFKEASTPSDPKPVVYSSEEQHANTVM